MFLKYPDKFSYYFSILFLVITSSNIRRAATITKNTVENIEINASAIFLFSFKNSFYNIIIIQNLEKVNKFLKNFLIYVTFL